MHAAYRWGLLQWSYLMTGFDSGAGGKALAGYSRKGNKKGPVMGVKPAPVSTTDNAYEIIL
tara:strand:+ start:301 stop:483 length:183 start_codon:yes stop_codon:yes gene_type:complete